MRIGIFTSSYPIGFTAPKRAARAVEFLKAKGHELILGELFHKSDFYRSGSIQERINEVNNLLNQDLDVLMAAIGGYVTNSILLGIDWKKMNKKKLIICGYSDITAILNASLNECPNIRALYGPNLVTSFGHFETELNEWTYQSFIKQVEKDGWIEIEKPEFWNDEFINWEEFQKNRDWNKSEWLVANKPPVDKIRGVLRGGNLSTLQGIWGSKFAPKWNKGDLLFVEDSWYKPEIIERFFSMLKLNGIFDQVQAIILGKHEQFNDQGTGRKPIDILLEVLGNQKVPIIYDVDCAHTHPMSILELNVETEIDFKNQKIYQTNS